MSYQNRKITKVLVLAGYAARDPCNFRVGNGSNGETASTSRMRNQTNFISEKASFPGKSSQISDMGTENMKVSIPEGGSLGNANNSSMCYIPGYPISSWDNPPRGNNMTGLKRIRGYGKMIPEPGNRASGLSHQFSFPLTSAEMNSMEEFLEFEDSVPCNTRAKRGCATHPRSIAERVSYQLVIPVVTLHHFNNQHHFEVVYTKHDCFCLLSLSL